MLTVRWTLLMQHSLGLLSVKVSEKSLQWTAMILASIGFTEECGRTSSLRMLGEPLIDIRDLHPTGVWEDAKTSI
jgi:hypothetical protein